MAETRKVRVEVPVPVELAEDFEEVLRTKAWELYLIYKWLSLPEAKQGQIEELAEEAKRKAAQRMG